MEILEYAIPFFILAILLEIAYARYYGKPFFRWNDSINDMTMGVFQQLTGVFIHIGLLWAYTFIFQYLSIQHFWNISFFTQNTWWNWIFTFFLVDFLYYWYHRKSHEINFLWASHVVHHQSEEYNLTVALRQGIFQVFFTFFFFIPIPVLAIPLNIFLPCYLIGVVYQFWIHTRVFPKLSYFEYIFNTPSQHRVHHAQNPIYIDKNYAAVFSIWDRLFGTFKEESEQPVYGVVKPVSTWNPVKQNFSNYIDLWNSLFRFKKINYILLYWCKPPGWCPPEYGSPILPHLNKPEEQIKYDPTVSDSVKWYSILKFLFLFIGVSFAQKYMEAHIGSNAVIVGFIMIWGLTNIGDLMENKPHARYSEYAWWLGFAIAVWYIVLP